MVLGIALVIVALFGGLRLIQGSPSSAAADPAVGGEVGAVVVAEGDQVLVAGPGDTLWSIASSLSPDGDPRPVVVALIEANGGESLQIGQQIVIPGHLLD
ncbi:MAG: LysM peptidoglycan-binding domain-containing protein [Actinomycetota bacterium]